MPSRTAYKLCTDTRANLESLITNGFLLESEICIITDENDQLGKVVSGSLVNIENQTAADAALLDGNNSAFYRNRTNHTGTQTLSTISDAGSLAALNSVDTTEIDNDAVTFAKLQNLNADVVIGATASGDAVEIPCTAAARALLDDGSASLQRQTLGLEIGVDVQGFDLDTVKSDENNTFTKAQRGTITTLTDGATITPDFDDSNDFTVTISGNRTLANPTNLTVGQSGVIYVIQDGVGNRTLSYGTYWKFPGGTAPTITSTSNSVDALSYHVRTSTSITVTHIADIK